MQQLQDTIIIYTIYLDINAVTVFGPPLIFLTNYLHLGILSSFSYNPVLYFILSTFIHLVVLWSFFAIFWPE